MIVSFNKSLFMKLKKTKKLIAGIKIAQQGSLVLRAWLGDERGKIKFFGECIWPYFHEKKLYSSIFTFFHFFQPYKTSANLRIISRDFLSHRSLLRF